MTFSIIAYDQNTDTIGVAAATGNLLVGQFVPHCVHGVGAVACQGFIPNPSLSWWCLQQLAMADDVASLQAVFEDCLGGSVNNQGAQLTVMDSRGQAWGYTGADNLAHCETLIESNLAIAGNWLAEASVLESMRACYHANLHKPLAERLLACLFAAEENGGDRRGLFSAALKLDDGHTMPVDCRVDYSERPILQLQALYQKTQSADYQKFLSQLPTTPTKPLKQLLRGDGVINLSLTTEESE